MSARPTDKHDLLELLPFAALSVNEKHQITHANTAAQPVAARLKSTLPEAVREAIGRAIAHERATKFTGEQIAPAFGPARQVWISPWGTEALVIIDSTDGTAQDYTTLSSTMAAMLAHEIRNPLLSIKGAAQLLAGSVTAEDAPLAALIVNEVARIDQLITTLDPLSPGAPNAQEALNVHELLGHAQLAVKAAHPRPVQFEIAYDPSLPEIMGNRDALVQALVNLLKNAAEATELVAMPKITLSTRYVLGETRRNAAGARLPIAIGISDNGRGVPPAFVPNLFAPFATTKTHGRGLGLAITARIAEEHGGLVVHDVPEAGGARFTLYLPMAPRNATPA
ncbi:MAG: hypothetical protein DI582_10590 [Azospirillum brasilense]|nr:MAG: hypothetical protein DI582_10590 [Azospirillum brasilense]